MAQNIPAMRGHMGSTEYYLVTMKASSLCEQLLSPKKWRAGIRFRPKRSSKENKLQESSGSDCAIPCRDPDRFWVIHSDSKESREYGVLFFI